MAEQYWIGGFFIDLSRNQVTQNQQSQTLAPKALAVLTHLAENQGKVVSHEALLTKVWPDTVVSPNTLQRSIAQLRKALGDDGKVQVYIKTHAKQGYSLECDVRWQGNIISAVQNSISLTESQDGENADSNVDNDETNTAINNATGTEAYATANTTANIKDKPTDSKSSFSVFAITLAIVFLAFIGYQFSAPTQVNSLSFGQLRALTTTDNKEHSGIYSPDGEYIVFNRYSEEFCASSNIWAKNINTQRETQLTEKMGRFGSHSFSQNGEKLVFVQTENCEQPITQKYCYKLKVLDFREALTSPQSPAVLMECENSIIRTPKWLNNNDIALMQQSSDRWKLIKYSVDEQKSQTIYEISDGNIIHYDYSIADSLLAITTVRNNGQYYIEIIETDGQLVSSHSINKPDEVAKYRGIYPNFSPLEDQLVFSTGRQLFTLSYDGEITNVSLPLDEPMGTPTFHPNGKRMLVIKGHWDSDIASIPLSTIVQSQRTLLSTDQDNLALDTTLGDNQSAYDFTVIERSIVSEDDAIFQPNGELIGYTSDRTGEDQLWVTDGAGAQQLSQFPMDSNIRGIQWASDGLSLLVNADNVLHQVFLDSSSTTFELEYPVVELYQWDNNNNTALIRTRVKGVLKLAELNLTTSDVQIINDQRITWAQKDNDGRLIYTDHMDRFWQPGPAEDKLIDALDGQGSDKHFIIKEQILYGINDDLQLWSYTLDGGVFKIIGDVPKNVDYLTDLEQEQFLMTVRVSAKKEVAELTLVE